MKGMRVQSIIRELRGEKIDIIEFSDDPVVFATHALSPAKISRVSIIGQPITRELLRNRVNVSTARVSGGACQPLRALLAPLPGRATTVARPASVSKRRGR